MTAPRRRKILFLLKHRDYLYTDEANRCYSYTTLCSGLYNSAMLVAQMLRELGHDVRLVQVRDNNCIDREVTQFRPDICVIEAYWVVPEKFTVLHKRHPRVLWVVRNHSAMPFAALEGVVVDWSLRYMDQPNVVLACNDDRTDGEFRRLVQLYKGWDDMELDERVVYLPNYYPPKVVIDNPRLPSATVNIGCFGAIRPLKNHLIQAVAAVEYAAWRNRPLRFHINATRIEQNSAAVLRNLQALFKLVPNAELIEHRWLKRYEFLTLCRLMDIGLNVSMSETFSIGTADLVTRNVPVVTSSEVPWVDSRYYAAPSDSKAIVKLIDKSLRWPNINVKRNVKGLRRFSERSQLIWSLFVDGWVAHQSDPLVSR